MGAAADEGVFVSKLKFFGGSSRGSPPGSVLNVMRAGPLIARKQGIG